MIITINGSSREVAKQQKENAPQVKTTEQDRTFASFKPRFEACLKIVREANRNL